MLDIKSHTDGMVVKKTIFRVKMIFFILLTKNKGMRVY